MISAIEAKKISDKFNEIYPDYEKSMWMKNVDSEIQQALVEGKYSVSVPFPRLEEWVDEYINNGYNVYVLGSNVVTITW